MPVRRRRAKSRRTLLTWAQKLELQIGPHADDAFGLGDYQASAFDSPADRRAAWYFHREELLEFGNPGSVSWGEIHFEGAADELAFPLPEGYETPQ